MNININFNNLINTILLVAKNQGLSEKYIYQNHQNWHIDHSINHNKEFEETVSKLDKMIEVIDQATQHHDMLAVKDAIISAEVYSHCLMNFFEKINNCIIQLVWGEELKDKWPNIPEDYKIPDCYDDQEIISEIPQMAVNIEFDKLMQTILLVAESQELSADYVYYTWYIDHRVNRNERFKRTVSELNKSVQLMNRALQRNDLVTVRFTIAKVEIYSQNLENFAKKINDDISQLGWGEELKDKWPKIPEDYRIPNCYGYEDTGRW